jgi:flagellar hook-associated protein 1 FlgK
MSSFYIGSSGLRSSQNALNTTAHNMTNIDTPGYTRQQVQLGSRSYFSIAVTPNSISNKEAGMGVNYSNVKQVRDVFLDKSFRRESGRSMFYQVSGEAMSEVESVLGEMDNSPFQTTMEDLWTAIQEMSKDPTSSVTQGLFLQRAGEFVERSNYIYKGLSEYQDNLNLQVKTQVNQINKYGQQILDLNQKIRAIEAGKMEEPNDLRDDRNRILDELSKLANITVGNDIYGNVTVQLEGVDFIKGVTCYEIGLKEDVATGFYTPFWPMNASFTYTAEGTKNYYIENAKVFDLDQQISSALNTDIGGLKATLLARGDHRANYTDMVSEESYDKISQSVVMNVQSEFDQLTHNVMTKINDIIANASGSLKVEEGTTLSVTYADGTTATLPEGSGYWISKPDGYLRTGDGQPMQIFDRAGAVNYEKATMTDSSTGQTVDIWVQVAEDTQWPDTLYTLGNVRINTLLSQQPSQLSFRLADGSEDQATTDALKAAFTDESYKLNPNMEKKNTFIDYYTDLVSQVANSGSVYHSLYEYQSTTMENIQSSREQIMGVSSDEELTNMIRFQNAYNASSRYINVISQMLEHLVSTLGA